MYLQFLFKNMFLAVCKGIALNPSTKEVEARRVVQIGGHPGLHSESQARGLYSESLSQNTK